MSTSSLSFQPAPLQPRMQQCLDIIRRGPVSRSAVASEMGITVYTASVYFHRLANRGLVHSTRTGQQSQWVYGPDPAARPIARAASVWAFAAT